MERTEVKGRDEAGAAHGGTGIVFAAVAVVLALCLALAYWVGRMALESNRALSERRGVIQRVERLLSTLKDAETGQRGYLLTGEERYLEPYQAAQERVYEELAALGRMAEAGELNKTEVAAVRQLSQEKLAELEETVQFKRKGQTEAALAVVRSERGKQLMDAIRGKISGLEERAVADFEAARRRMLKAMRVRNWTFVGTGVVSLAFVEWARRRIRQAMAEQRQAEEALRRNEELHRAELERLVTERTAQLAEANVNLQAFTHTAAHDLRAPLRSIKAFAGIIVEEYGGQLGEDGRGLMQRLRGSAEQMERLLNELLEYSQVSQGEVPLAPVSLSEAVREALQLLDGEIQQKNARIKVEEPLPQVIGHRATLVLLLNNFVANALKFMPPGVQPEIGIAAGRRGEFVRIAVQDNGIGIAPADVGKMFVAFQRLHGKQSYPGTGLGLAIVRKGAERMGGRVGVESEVGKGSRFWVELRGIANSQ